MRIGRVFRALILLAAAACAAPDSSSPLPGQPVLGKILSARRIEAGGETVGYLVEMEFDAPGLEKRFAVQNPFRQEIGFIDANGRAYRYRSPDGETEHAATGTMEQNLQAILRESRPLQILTTP